MKRVCIFTATRAEYGLLRNVILKLQAKRDFDVRVVVTGMHLSEAYGNTYREIEDDGIIIDEKIDILEWGISDIDVSKTMAKALAEFSDYFSKLQPDMLIVLGDRYETLAVCIAAMNHRIMIAHLYGGETTEGAIDEAIRHAITKMSYLHFTSLESYRKRVIQLGEDPKRVFCVGSMGIENIETMELYTKEEIEKEIGFSLDKNYAVVTFHPVTLENVTAHEQTLELLQSFNLFSDLRFIITKANADEGGEDINCMLEEYAASHPEKVYLSASLGTKMYLSALKYSYMVIGNSSSGIMEAPVFKVPTINIGDRQRGRVQPQSVINCQPVCLEITRAIEHAMSEGFRNMLSEYHNPYGTACTSKRITDIISDTLEEVSGDLKKTFYDIDFEV